MIFDPTALPKIWFLRHGETFWNVEKRIQGQLESELTPKGHSDAQAQARLMVSVLTANPECFVSPLGRAQQTAKIALAGSYFRTDARLAEAHAGAWQGLLRPDVIAAHSDRLPANISALELFLAAPVGEGYDAFKARIVSFLNDLSGPSVVVAHGLLGQVMRGLIQGLPRTEMGNLSNEQACLYVLENGEERVIREENK